MRKSLSITFFVISLTGKDDKRGSPGRFSCSCHEAASEQQRPKDGARRVKTDTSSDRFKVAGAATGSSNGYETSTKLGNKVSKLVPRETKM